MKKIIFGVCCAYIFLCPAPALARGIFMELDTSQPWHVVQRSEYVPESDVGAQDGDFTIGCAVLNLKKEYKFPNGLPVDLTFDLTHYDIHDETSVDLPASLESKGVALGTKMPMPFVKDERFFIGLDTGAYFQSAKEHNFDSSTFRSKNRFYGIFKYSDRFIVVAGGMYRTDYEDNSFIPFVGFRYVLNDRWSFHFLSDKPFIQYQWNKRTTIKWLFEAYRDEFEVVSGARKGEIVKISEFHMGLAVDYEIKKDVNFQVSAGWAFNREYEYKTGDGKIAPDDSLFFGYTFKMLF